MKQRLPPQRLKRHDKLAQESRMLSAQEKRELILAHAAARTKKPSGWGFGYSVGLVASCLVVLTGWWLTLGVNLQYPLPLGSDASSQTLHQDLQKLQTQLDLPQTNLGSIKADVSVQLKEIRQGYQNAVLQERAMQEAALRIKALRQGSTSSSQ